VDVDLDRAGSLNLDQMLNARRKVNLSNEVSTQLTFDYEFVDHPGYTPTAGQQHLCRPGTLAASAQDEERPAAFHLESRKLNAK
jgi:hypothetical protein